MRKSYTNKFISYFLSFVSCFLFLVSCPLSHAFASYVLPYPSYMPGNKLYSIQRFVDSAKSYWYWGSIGKIKYYRLMSDKALVEAKVLFEYKQYELAMTALERSNNAINNIPYFVAKGVGEGKDMRGEKQIINDEIEEHTVKLSDIKTWTPETAEWSPENKTSKILPIHGAIDNAIRAREQLLIDML